MGVAASRSAVSLTPATSVLAGPSVVYPVFVDPQWSLTTPADGATWSDVQRNGLDSTGGGDWEPTSAQFGGIRAGVACNAWYSDGSCVPGTTYTTTRSFLNFPTPPSGLGFYGAGFVRAQLQIVESWSWGCSPPGGPTLIELWDTDNNGSNVRTTQSSGLTWQSQPARGNSNDQAAVEHGDTCPTAMVPLSATVAAQEASQNNWNWLTLRLSATLADENSLNQWSWKRFDASSMQLVYYWRTAPELPTGTGIQGAFDASTGQTMASDCSASQSSPDWVNTTSPEWQATIGDKNSGEQIDGEFPWQNKTTGNTGTLDAGGLLPGSLFEASRNGGDNDEYSFQAYGATPPTTDPFNDSVPELDGPTTSSCWFQIDTGSDMAQVAAAISGPQSAQVGSSNNYTFTAVAPDVGVNGKGTVNDVVGFYWGIDNPQPSTYVQATPGAIDPATSLPVSTATVPFTPFNMAEADLYVQPVDRAGNRGVVSGPYPVTATTLQGNIAETAWWELNNNGDDAATAAGKADAGLTLSSGASFGCFTQVLANPAGYACSLTLDGQSGRAYAGRPVMGNDGSFSVSAWADPAGCGSSSAPQYCAVLSQGASTVSAFTLGYQRYGSANGAVSAVQCPCWIFAMPHQDTAGGEYTVSGSSAGWSTAAAPAGSSALNAWTQLTAVFNASHNELDLYVNGGDGTHPGNGVPAATQGQVTPWSAGPGNGVFRIGADWTGANGGPQDFFSGAVSDACVFAGVLLATAGQPDVQNLYDSGSGDGCAALYQTYDG
jgi:hypothetical protein